MSDPYSDLANAPEDMQLRIAQAMAARCQEQAQIDLRREYLGFLPLEPQHPKTILRMQLLGQRFDQNEDHPEQVHRL